MTVHICCCVQDKVLKYSTLHLQVYIMRINYIINECMIQCLTETIIVGLYIDGNELRRLVD